MVRRTVPPPLDTAVAAVACASNPAASLMRKKIDCRDACAPEVGGESSVRNCGDWDAIPYQYGTTVVTALCLDWICSVPSYAPGVRPVPLKLTSTGCVCPAPICTGFGVTVGALPMPLIGETVIDSVSAAVPIFVSASTAVRFTVVPPSPNEIETGSAVTVFVTADNIFSNPVPVCCTDEPPANGEALSINSDRYSPNVRPGRAALSSAAAPASIGDEKLVPLSTT